MLPGRLWTNIDPTQFNDGVLYLPAMVEIQPKANDWGVPDMASLLARIHEDQPHGGDERTGKLLCLKCMAIDARHGAEPRPVWMYFQQRNGLRLFCHMGSGHVHAEHMPVSDEHKALVEREVRTCERVGAAVNTEVRTANGRRRADFIAVGPEVTLAGEVQRSIEPVQRINKRQRDLSRDGKRVVWTTDNPQNEFLMNVPRLVIPALTGWQQALQEPELAVVAGLTLVEYQPCGWTDQWSGTTRCPHTGLLRSCGRTHAYPTADVNPRTYKPTNGPIAQFGLGNRPHLDWVLAGIVLAQWLPYERTSRVGRQFVWMPADDYARFVEDRGVGSLRVGGRITGISFEPTESAARTCEYDDTTGRATVVDTKPAVRSIGKGSLEWRSHGIGDPRPCQYCGKGAICRDEYGVPTHKVCAEKHMSDSSA